MRESMIDKRIRLAQLNRMIILILLVSALTSSFSSCSDNEIGPLSQLSFSRDTVLFDTVFTQMGSHTEAFLIRNTGSQPVQISRVYLGGASASSYRFNINGYPGGTNNMVEDIEIEGNDSMYVFVEVTIDPNNGTAPLIYEDSLVVEVGNAYKRAMLVSFGQDAIYFYPTDTLSGSNIPYSIIPCDMVWTAEKPYVIVGWAVVDSDCKLTIQPGTRIHFFNNGALWVYQDATIRVLGERENPVVFQGTRLEYKYRNDPGQWDRILINEGSTQNVIRNAVIKNGFIGLQCDNYKAIANNPGTPNQLTLENVIIQNMSGLGIYTNNYNLTGYNLLINNCGQYSAAFAYGGNIKLYHSTIVNYWSRSIRNFPALFMNNFYATQTNLLSQPLSANFYNCIVYGNAETEIGWDSVTASTIQFRFDHCLIKMHSDISTVNTNRFYEIVKNADPKFSDSYNQDFRVKQGSSAIDKGDPSFVTSHNNELLFDLKGANRLWTGKPDLGAYEYP